MNNFPLPNGSLVLVSRAMPTWSGRWIVPQMDFAVGKIGTVLETNSEGTSCRIKIPGILSYWYPRVVLCLVDDMLPGHGPNNMHLAQELPP
jgi:hypothetical protein